MRGLNFKLGSSANTAGVTKFNRAMERAGRRALKTALDTAKMSRATREASQAMAQHAAAVKSQTAALNRKTSGSNRTTRAIKRTTAATKRSTRETKRNTRVQRANNMETSKASALIRRLLSAMLIYGAMTQLIYGFKSLIKTSLGFNRNIEAAQLGIAALITASVDVKDAYGNLVGISEKFAYAQGEAARQAALLRKDALMTEATYDQLLSTFQIGIAPGISGGLNLDEIREFTLRISQAATALDMAQVHLAEEIRSILQGTIKITTTRIAAALQITNADIRKWRQSGDLAKELFERFEAFKASGKYLKETMKGLTGRVRDAFSQMLGEAGKGLFDDAKKSLRVVFDLLTNITEAGVEFDSRVLAIFKRFFQAIRNVVAHAKGLADAITFEDAYRTVSRFSYLLEETAKVVIAIGIGFKKAMGSVSRMVGFLGKLFKKMDLLGISVLDLVAKTTEVAILWGLVGSSVKLLRFSFVAVNGLITKTLTGMGALVGMFTLANAIWLSIVGMLLAFAKVIHDDVCKDLGIGNDLVLHMMTSFKIMANYAGLIGSTLSSGMKMAAQVVGTALDRMLLGYLQVKRAALLVMSVTKPKDDPIVGEIGKLDNRIADIQHEAGIKDAERLNKIRDEMEKIQNKWSNFKWDEGIDKIYAEAAGKTGLEALKTKVQDVFKDAAGSEIADFIKSMTQSLSEALGMGDIGGASKILDEYKKKLDEIEAQKARAAASPSGTMAASLQPLEAGVLEQLEQQIDARIKLDRLYEAHKSRQVDIALGDLSTEQQKNEAIEESIRLEKDRVQTLYQKDKAIEQAAQKVELLQLEVEGGPWNALESGLKTFAYGVKTTFEGIRDIITGTLDALADSISSTIIDAFDPTKKVDLKERFGKFLQDIAKMILQTFLRIAIAKAALRLVGGGIGGAGMWKGGLVTHQSHPQGLAAGGSPAPPRGLHPSDRIPIWAAKNEFMMRVSAVQKYGSNVMDSINQGLVDPIALKGLAGTSQAIRSSRGGPGYAEGGEISADQAVPTSSGQDTSIHRSYIVADDETLDNLLSGGQGALFRFFRENRDEINGSLK